MAKEVQFHKVKGAVPDPAVHSGGSLEKADGGGGGGGRTEGPEEGSV